MVAKPDDRAVLCASLRGQGTYLNSAAGPPREHYGPRLDGQATIRELGVLLAQTDRFPAKSQMVVSDIDVERLRLERMRRPSFNNAVAASGRPETRFRRVGFHHKPGFDNVDLGDCRSWARTFAGAGACCRRRRRDPEHPAKIGPYELQDFNVFYLTPAPSDGSARIWLDQEKANVP